MFMEAPQMDRVEFAVMVVWVILGWIFIGFVVAWLMSL